MKKILLIFIACFWVTPVFANSLWDDSGSLFSDHKAKAIGDVVTIIIQESSSATRTGKADNSKTANAAAKAGVGIFDFITQADTSYNDSSKSQGSISNSNNVFAKITAQITEVKPNGNLVLNGKQTIDQNGETQIICIKGIVRAEDIRPDNTVLSSNVAEANVSIEGKGPISKKQRQGILSQLFGWLF